MKISVIGEIAGNNLSERLFLLGIRNAKDKSQPLEIQKCKHGFELTLNEEDVLSLKQKTGKADIDEAIRYISSLQIVELHNKTKFEHSFKILIPAFSDKSVNWKNSGSLDDFGVIAQELSNLIINTPYLDLESFGDKGSKPKYSATEDTKWAQAIGGVKLWRPNHDSTHSVRKTVSAMNLIEIVKENGKPEFKTAALVMTPEQISCLQLASFLSRSGRSNEIDSKKDPSNLTRSGEIFSIIAKELGFDKDLIKEMQYLLSNHIEPSMIEYLDQLFEFKHLSVSQAKLIKKIFETSHHSDLQRCWHDTKESRNKIAGPIKENMRYLLKDKSHEYTNGIINSMSKMSIYTGEKLKKNNYNSSFFLPNTPTEIPYDLKIKNQVAQNTELYLHELSSNAYFNFTPVSDTSHLEKISKARREHKALQALKHPFFAKTVRGFAKEEAWTEVKDSLTEGPKPQFRKVRDPKLHRFELRIGNEGKIEVYDTNDRSKSKFIREKSKLYKQSSPPWLRKLPPHQSFTYYDPNDPDFNPLYFGHDKEERMVGLRCRADTALINRIIVSDTGTYHRTYAYSTQEQAQKAITKLYNPRNPLGKLLSTIGIGDSNSQRWATNLIELKKFTKSSDIPYNECMIRTSWQCGDYSSQVVVYKDNFPSKFLAILRALDIEEMLGKNKRFFEQAPYNWHEGYKVPISFWGNGRHGKLKLYTESEQEKDLSKVQGNISTLILQGIIFYIYKSPGELPKNLEEALIELLNTSNPDLWELALEESHTRDYTDFYKMLFSSSKLKDEVKQRMATSLLNKTRSSMLSSEPLSSLQYAIKHSPARASAILELFKSINVRDKDRYLLDLFIPAEQKLDKIMSLAIEHNPQTLPAIFQSIMSISNLVQREELLKRALQKVILNKGSTALLDPVRHIQELKIDDQPALLYIYKKLGPYYVESVLPRGFDKNVVDKDGNTLLHLAVEDQDTVLIKRLINSGTDINKRNSANRTAGELSDDSYIRSLLGTPGSELSPPNRIPDIPREVDILKSPVTNLMYVALETKKSLTAEQLVRIQNHADLHSEKYNLPPIIRAIRSEHDQLFTFFLDNHVDPNTSSSSGNKSALLESVIINRYDYALALLNKGARSYGYQAGKYIIDNDLLLAIFFQDKPPLNETQKTDLDELASRIMLDYSTHRFELNDQALLNSYNKSLELNLPKTQQIIYQYLFDNFLNAIENTYTLRIEWFLENLPLHFDQSNYNSGAHALLRALYFQQYPLAVKLINRGAQLPGNVIDQYQFLLKACAMESPDKELISSLIKLQANPMIEDEVGNTPLILAKDNLEIIELLAGEATPKMLLDLAQSARANNLPKTYIWCLKKQSLLEAACEAQQTPVKALLARMYDQTKTTSESTSLLVNEVTIKVKKTRRGKKRQQEPGEKEFVAQNQNLHKKPESRRGPRKSRQ